MDTGRIHWHLSLSHPNRYRYQGHHASQARCTRPGSVQTSFQQSGGPPRGHRGECDLQRARVDQVHPHSEGPDPVHVGRGSGGGYGISDTKAPRSRPHLPVICRRKPEHIDADSTERLAQHDHPSAHLGALLVSRTLVRSDSSCNREPNGHHFRNILGFTTFPPS